MRKSATHLEGHPSTWTSWLRAAILGSNDAIVSTASLMVGVQASSASGLTVAVVGMAALVAGAMSMAVGEYVSVSSQRDAEQADIEREKNELARQPKAELRELAGLYQNRGLDPDLAMRVAEQLSARDRLAAHLRDELGIDTDALAKPVQAAWVSALSFACFAAIPIGASLLSPARDRSYVIVAISLASLAALGATGAHLGGAPRIPASLRVTIGGGIAMAVTAFVGRLLGTAAG